MIMRNTTYYLLSLVLALVVAGCRNNNDPSANEDRSAKKMLQGIWMDDENENAVFWAKGDSIFYPDSSSQPAKFWIRGDSLYLQNSEISHYKITKQADHLFKFINEMGDEVKLVKDDAMTLRGQFNVYRPYAMNIFRTLSTDTLLHADGSRWQVKIRVAPTSEKVMKTDYNDEGLEVNNLYLDNTANVTILFDGVVVYQHDFVKGEFERYLPKELIAKSMLRDIEFDRADASNVYLDATVGIPDASSSYVIETRVQRDGKIAMRVK